MKHFNIFIDGQWIGEDLEKIDVINPATSEVVATVPNAGKKEAEHAIASAYRAFSEWSSLSAYERSEYIRQWYDLIMSIKMSLLKQ